MDIYKQKYTGLQQEILRLLFANIGKELNKREISLKLEVSPTAVSNSLKTLEKEELINVSLNKRSKTFEISLNINNQKVFYLKKVENLRQIYESGLKEFLEEKFPGKTIVLFGSFSRGEDYPDSDIDIAILEQDEKEINLKKFEEILGKKINIQFYLKIEGIHKNLRENLFNGIVLTGGFRL